MTKTPGVSIYDLPSEHYDSTTTTELAQNMFNTVAKEVKNNLKEKTRVLDLCCGTGVLACMFFDMPGIEFVGVDFNRTFLEAARKRTGNRTNFKFTLGDAFRFSTDSRFDVVLLISAYHHAKDGEKTAFLRNISGLLREDGVMIMYEMAVPPYSGKEEFAKSNEEMYLKKIEYLKNTGGNALSKTQLDAFMNCCALSAAAEGEYKVDYDFIANDLDAAGFEVVKEIKLWPKEDLFQNERVGDFVFVARKKK